MKENLADKFNRLYELKKKDILNHKEEEEERQLMHFFKRLRADIVILLNHKKHEIKKGKI
ncbi:hypothetical protein [Comamonas sp. JUb58]|uniref:hypothetical protein n=1 Tax=Comamonas sp. JUb58 TaxID=2485114 RepID=UPI00106121FB|nr:hypothetical protein [Comamonas sp. JUb58]